MKLYDLLDRHHLAQMIEDGYVREQVHPSEPLCILNYTEKAAYEREWNPVTLACRGLIYDMVTERIVARPFEKFFNYQELREDWVAAHMSEKVRVFDKLDGSLGIIYKEPISGLWSVATRGSFASEQAIHATEILRSKFGYWEPNPELTYLAEIIYPANRIVLNYGGMDDLVLLGMVEIETGESFTPDLAFSWLAYGERAKSFGRMTLAQALELPPRDNAEGVVMLFDDGMRVKFKQEDYVALHRLVTGMNDRVIWERLGNEESIDDIKRGMPEEFWPWIDQVADGLFQQADQIIMSVWQEYLSHIACLPEDFTRKDFALSVKDSPNKGYLFNYLDGKPIYKAVWKTLKPAAVRSLVEDDDE